MFDMFFDDNFGGGGGAPGKGDITHIYLAAASGDETPTDEEVHRFFLTLRNHSLSIQPKDSRTADGQMIYTVNGSQACVSDVFRQVGGYVDNFDASGCTGIDSRRFSQLEGAITVRLPEQHA